MYHIYSWTWCNVEDGFWVLDLLLGKSCNEEGHPAKIEPACSFISFICLFRLKFNMKYLIVSAFFSSFDPFRSFYTHPNWACPCAKKQSPQSHPRGLLLLHDRPHPRNFCAARNAVENFHGNAGTKEYTSTIQKPSISADHLQVPPVCLATIHHGCCYVLAIYCGAFWWRNMIGELSIGRFRKMGDNMIMVIYCGGIK